VKDDLYCVYIYFPALESLINPLNHSYKLLSNPHQLQGPNSSMKYQCTARAKFMPELRNFRLKNSVLFGGKTKKRKG
jgi:hypothetical protein